MGYIDAHVHVWTDEYEDYPFASGHEPADAKPPTFFAEDILNHAQPCGVERVVLVQMSYYGNDNTYMLEVMARHPGIFAGIGKVDPRGPRPDEEMVRLAQDGIRGFRISPANAPAETWLDGDAYARMFEAGAHHNLALCPLISPAGFKSLAERCEQFPETPVVIDHLGLVGASGEIQEQDVDALCSLARHPRVMVKVSAFYALGTKEAPHDDLAPLIRRVWEAFGAQRLMWASDAPYQVQAPHTYEASVSLVRDRLGFLSDADRDQILGGTAEGFFFPS